MSSIDTKKRSPKRHFAWPILLIVLAIVIAVVFVKVFREVRAPFELDTGGLYTQLDLPLNTDQLDDLGLADIDGDGHLDIFGVNHSNEHTLLRSLGDGRFVPFPEDSFALPQEDSFPALINLTLEPQFPTKGVLLYWKDEQFNARATQLAQPFEGALTFRTDVEITGSHNAAVHLTQSDATRYIVDFTLREGGHLTIRTLPNPRLGFPVTVDLGADILLNSVHVGAIGAHPENRTFTLRLRDRHAFAWTRLDGDDRADVLAAGGGLRGYATTIVPDADEQLFLTQSGTFKDVGKERGILKLGCASRKTTWVDFDADGDLDLHIACDRGRGDRLWRRAPDGFEDASASTGLDVGNAKYWMWLDAEGDGTQELYTVADDTLWVHTYRDDSFDRSFGTQLPGNWIRDTAVGDPDADGNVDILMAMGSEVVVLTIKDGIIDSGSPPANVTDWAECISWVDYNGDGLEDIFSLPGGIFEQQEGGRFVGTNILDIRSEGHAPEEAWCNWADLNGDGLLDLVVAINQQARWEASWRRWLREAGRSLGLISKQTVTAAVYLRHSARDSPRWLQVDLDGPPQNRDGIGAIVTAYVDGSVQTRRVGDAEGSHHSQGHYRLYFGGMADRVDSLVVQWPGGAVTRSQDIPFSQRIVATPSPRAD